MNDETLRFNWDNHNLNSLFPYNVEDVFESTVETHTHTLPNLTVQIIFVQQISFN